MNIEAQRSEFAVQPYVNIAGVCMFGNVRQCFLEDAQDYDLAGEQGCAIVVGL